ncbi:MAG: hypothetical protein J5994_02315 [Ruminococcus sp.]|nr:hypothetical protein [Ruminococcus sp.]
MDKVNLNDEVHDYIVEQTDRDDRKSKIFRAVFTAFLICVILFLIIYGISWIPVKISFTAEGAYWTEESGDIEENLTVDGYLFSPLFTDYDEFKGRIKFEEHAQYNFVPTDNVYYGSDKDDELRTYHIAWINGGTYAVIDISEDHESVLCTFTNTNDWGYEYMGIFHTKDIVINSYDSYTYIGV